MSRTHDVTISAFDLDYLEKELSAAREAIKLLKTNLEISFRQTEQAVQDRADEHKILIEQGDYLEKELSAERALADRLALALGDFLNSHLVDTALEAWKEARK